MAEFYKTSSELCFISFLTKIAKSILKELTGNTFSVLLLPLLHYVSSNNFLNHKPSGMTANALTADIYKLINSALELDKLKVEDFMRSEMGKRMLALFELEDDLELRRELVFVFTHVCLSIQDEGVQIAIERALLRTRELDQKNFELASHIDQLLFLFRH